MDYPEHRQKYLRICQDYLYKLELNFQLLDSVRRWSPELWKETEAKPKKIVIKSYILLELTKTRESCTKVIKLLRESKVDQNIDIADGLQMFNTSPGRITYGDEIEIPVTPVLSTDVKWPNTRNYSMIKKPRGKAIIINFVPNEVQREAQRFSHIFHQLIFDPQIYFSLTTAEMKENFKEFAKDLNEQHFMDEALIVMVITAGVNEMLVGRNHPSCGGKDKNDIVHISDIVDIFAEIDIIKIFFFTCCRIDDEGQQIPEDMICSKKEGFDIYANTFVFYSTTLGYDKHGYTVSGRKLSESIAQYANSHSLTEIINRTNQALMNEYKVNSKELRNYYGYYAPETKQKCITHNLYFNPGWYEGKAE